MANPWEESDSQQEYPSWNWREGDWQQYLLITDSQIKQFGELYHLLVDDPERLDKIARRMGWTLEGWQAGEVEDGEQLSAEEIPYTMHLHPVYTVTRGVFKSLYDICMSFAKLNGEKTVLQLALMATLHEAEMQAILGIESQDMGDMSLTVCHFKRSLAQLNHALALLDRMATEKVAGIELFAREIRKRIFDLREIWLRVNSEVRQEIQRRGENGD